VGQFLASGAGRAARIAAGIMLIGLGLGVVGAPAGAVMAIVGLVPLTAGIADVCIISALLGGPFRGQDIRGLAR